MRVLPHPGKVRNLIVIAGILLLGSGLAGNAVATAGASPIGYGPSGLLSAYHLASAAASGGKGATVAIVGAFDDPTAASDLAVYRSLYGLPACTTANGCFSKVNEDGQASPLPPGSGVGDTVATWVEEESMDMDMVSAICPSWTCNGLTTQRWTFAQDGTLRIHGKCLDARGYGTTVGTKLQLWSCTGGTNQKWVVASNGELAGVGSGHCVSDPGAVANGTKIDVAACENIRQRQWTFEPDGTIRVLGKCMTLKTAGGGVGTPVVLETCQSGNASQRWSVSSMGGGDLDGQISAGSAGCLSVPSMTAGNGAQLATGLCDALPQTLWHVW